MVDMETVAEPARKIVSPLRFAACLHTMTHLSEACLVNTQEEFEEKSIMRMVGVFAKAIGW